MNPLSDRTLFAGVFLLALAVQLVFQQLATPVDWPDTAVYVADGNGLFAHGVTSSYLYMPLYPILIHLLGTSGILWLQAFVAALTAALAALLALEIFASRAAAAVAGLAVAFHPVLIFYANMRLSETVFIFLETAAFAAFYRKSWWLGSACTVLAILTRPILDLAAPLLVASFCAVHRTLDWRTLARRLGTYAAVYVALMSPWWFHNYHKYGSFVRLDLGDGIVMRIENNSTFDKVGLDFGAFKEALDISPLDDPVVLNETRKAAAYRYIAEHPAHYFVRSIERLGRFWTPLQGSSTRAVEIVAAMATVPIYFGALMCLARTRWRPLLPILWLILFMSAVHAATHALPRYRLPLEPLLAVLAAGWYGPAIAAFAARSAAGQVPPANYGQGSGHGKAKESAT
jgi:hypothetical protein